ncbi:MAG: hypothetical protein ACXW11_00780 [Methylotenera sp.]
MINNKPKQLLALLLLGLISSAPVLARDVSNEQYAVTTVQKEYDQAKADYDAATVLVNDQKRRVAQDQALLNELQKKQAAAEAKLVKTTASLDKRKAELNSAWNKGSW